MEAPSRGLIWTNKTIVIYHGAGHRLFSLRRLSLATESPLMISTRAVSAIAGLYLQPQLLLRSLSAWWNSSLTPKMLRTKQASTVWTCTHLVSLHPLSLMTTWSQEAAITISRTLAKTNPYGDHSLRRPLPSSTATTFTLLPAGLFSLSRISSIPRRSQNFLTLRSQQINSGRGS